jgi:glycosyltransferase involved in cell wall biosynthesis
VTIAVPCFNAEASLSRTLHSVASQTHSDIEVLIVDDGSTDRTSQIAKRFARRDKRIRLLASPVNHGVAAARNMALAYANGDFFAPIDSDDLWKPDKLELLLRPLLTDSAVGLAYSWFDYIDDDDRIFHGGFRYSFQGDVLARLCQVDFIGNGSNAVMRTALVRAAGGYDSSLRARGGEGCEDWKLALELAQRSQFAVVTQPLTGYRLSTTNMSNRVVQMVRSAELVAHDFSALHPQYTQILSLHVLNRTFCGLARSIRRRRWKDAKWLAQRTTCFGTRAGLTAFCDFVFQELVRNSQRVLRVAKRGLLSPAPRPRFLELNPPAPP